MIVNSPADNTDAEELRKFEQLASDWWNPAGSLKTLHIINPVRLAYIRERCDLANSKVLDIGCGGGLLSEAMCQSGARVTGLDANENLVQIAREHAQSANLNIDYVAATAEEFAENNKAEFDLVTCMELLEHVPDPASVLSACTSLLKPGGEIVLATLNRNLRSYASAILAAEYMLKLVPRGTHEYAKFLRPSEIARDLRQRGYRVTDISGMHYIPLIDHCFLNRDPGVNYLLHARRLAS